MTDPVFTRFRRALEDGVTYAINVKKRKIGKGGRKFCPIGACGDGLGNQPGPTTVMAAYGKLPHGILDVDYNGINAFMAGFDGFDGDKYSQVDYYNLGKLYRDRFVGGPNGRR